MSASDYRYLQAWARPSASKPASSSSSRRTYDSGNSFEVLLPTTNGDTATPAAQLESKEAIQQSAYQIRLDTPGGISYAPDDLAQHNSSKRLFIPDRSANEYNFAREIEAKSNKASATTTPQPELDELGLTQAQAYKESVEQTETDSTTMNNDQGHVKPFNIPTTSVAANEQDQALTPQQGGQDAASIMTDARTATVYGDAAHSRTPWAAASDWTSHRALDRPTDKEKKLEITQFEQATEGRGHSAYEASLFPSSDTQSDAATIKTLRPGELRIEDLFLPDPRPWRPLRYVRKIDPRQLLILCAGAALTPGQFAAIKVGSDASSVFTTEITATGRDPSDAASIFSSVPTDFSVAALSSTL
ncbi:uncharacterized protein UDID_19601 [Ustilago sp. UG-2017a]|nr:uncharacterized protein UDID_19601 [Ustilago sp. UG-2017a]